MEAEFLDASSIAVDVGYQLGHRIAWANTHSVRWDDDHLPR
jgi:hypothetical protein